MPASVTKYISNLDSLDRIYFFSSFIRWDYTWNFLKTLCHMNRFGPSLSSLTSFAIKALNNLLLTGDILAKRYQLIYNNWTCVFCNIALESLRHLMICLSLSQQWLSVSNSILNFLHSLTNKLQIRADIPMDPQHFFPALPGQSDSQLLPPVQSLSIGIFPAYILSDLYNMEICCQLDVISTNLLKYTIKAFRDTIWKPRCILNAEKENDLASP